MHFPEVGTLEITLWSNYRQIDESEHITKENPEITFTKKKKKTEGERGILSWEDGGRIWRDEEVARSHGCSEEAPSGSGDMSWILFILWEPTIL